MSILSDSVLVESRAAREHQLGGMSHDRAQAILTKVKNLYFSLWKGTGIATTEQVADFYEVPAANIRKAVERHRSEVESDGLQVLSSKALKQVSDERVTHLHRPENYSTHPSLNTTLGHDDGRFRHCQSS